MCVRSCVRACINFHAGKPASDACFASGWNRHLLNQTTFFMNHTGLSMIETGAFDSPALCWLPTLSVQYV